MRIFRPKIYGQKIILFSLNLSLNFKFGLQKRKFLRFYKNEKARECQSGVGTLPCQTSDNQIFSTLGIKKRHN